MQIFSFAKIYNVETEWGVHFYSDYNFSLSLTNQ